MDRILVTGANGFIGSHLVELLIRESAEDDEIICMVRHTSDLSNILESLKHPKVRIVTGDVTKPETLPNAVKGVTYVYHVAAELYAISRNRFIEANTEGTENLLKAVDEHAQKSLKRFLFVSSQAAAGPSQSTNPVTEDDEPSSPVSYYAESKLEAEKLVRQYGSKFHVTIVRPCSVYGEGDKGFLQAFTGVEMRVHAVTGFRKRYTGMIYGKDLVTGILAASRSEAAEGQTYFLANSHPYTVKEVMKEMARAVGRSFGITVPVPLFIFRFVAYLSELLYLYPITR
jgi:nucleoside-diphosphate-sugar epimerase